jgi:hypothetical protein
VRKVLLGVAVLLVLALAVPVYLRLGWTRMTDRCDGDLVAAGMSGVKRGSVSYSWDWPKGFTCRFSDGSKRQSLWF